MSSRLWVVVALMSVMAFAIKGIGPIAFGGRQLPSWFGRVVLLLAPAVLCALVVTQAFADGEELTIGADTAGVAAAAVLLWRKSSVLVAVGAAMAVTAALRAVA